MLEIDSTFEEAYFNIGNTYVGIYRDHMLQYTKDTIVEKALENFQKAVDINPRYVQAWYNLGLDMKSKVINKLLERFIIIFFQLKRIMNQLLKA